MSQKLQVNKGTLAVHARRPQFTLPEGFQNRGEYHLTLLDPRDLKAIKSSKGWSNKELDTWLKSQEGQSIDGSPRGLGIGTAIDGDNQVYFEVIEWPEAQAWRAALGLSHKDLHVTAGFLVSDIFGVLKNRSTLIASDHSLLLAYEIEALDPG